MIQRILSVAALVILAWGVLPDHYVPAQEKPMALTPQMFVEMASAMDLAEIQLAKMALKNASRPEVKQFASRMITDHTMSSAELLKIVGPKGLQPSEQPDNKHQALITRLATLKGAEFDGAYLQHMVMDHQMAVSLYQAQTQQGKDPQLRAFAAKTLPIVQEHLKLAEKLARKEGGTKHH